MNADNTSNQPNEAAAGDFARAIVARHLVMAGRISSRLFPTLRGLGIRSQGPGTLAAKLSSSFRGAFPAASRATALSTRVFRSQERGPVAYRQPQMIWVGRTGELIEQTSEEDESAFYADLAERFAEIRAIRDQGEPPEETRPETRATASGPQPAPERQKAGPRRVFRKVEEFSSRSSLPPVPVPDAQAPEAPSSEPDEDMTAIPGREPTERTLAETDLPPSGPHRESVARREDRPLPRPLDRQLEEVVRRETPPAPEPAGTQTPQTQPPIVSQEGPTTDEDKPPVSPRPESPPSRRHPPEAQTPTGPPAPQAGPEAAKPVAPPIQRAPATDARASAADSMEGEVPTPQPPPPEQPIETPAPAEPGARPPTDVISEEPVPRGSVPPSTIPEPTPKPHAEQQPRPLARPTPPGTPPPLTHPPIQRTDAPKPTIQRELAHDIEDRAAGEPERPSPTPPDSGPLISHRPTQPPTPETPRGEPEEERGTIDRTPPGEAPAYPPTPQIEGAPQQPTETLAEQIVDRYLRERSRRDTRPTEPLPYVEPTTAPEPTQETEWPEGFRAETGLTEQAPRIQPKAAEMPPKEPASEGPESPIPPTAEMATRDRGPQQTRPEAFAEAIMRRYESTEPPAVPPRTQPLQRVFEPEQHEPAGVRRAVDADREMRSTPHFIGPPPAAEPRARGMRFAIDETAPETAERRLSAARARPVPEFDTHPVQRRTAAEATVESEPRMRRQPLPDLVLARVPARSEPGRGAHDATGPEQARAEPASQAEQQAPAAETEGQAPNMESIAEQVYLRVKERLRNEIDRRGRR